MGYRMQIYRIRAGILHRYREKMQKLKKNFWYLRKKPYICTRVEVTTRRPGPVPGKETDNETELQQTRNRNVGPYPFRG